MYATLMQTLRTFFGYEMMRVCMAASLAVVVIVLATNASLAFRAAWARLRKREGWRGSLSGLAGGVFKCLIVLVLARLFVTTLAFQQEIFGQEHGRITESNRSAVLMKWGYPHEQRELSVSHTRKRTWVTRQLRIKIKDEPEKIFSESFWRDAEPPIRAVDGQLPTIVSALEEIKDVSVEQKSIGSADIDITVKNNPRRLGNANYAGYDDTWRFKYVVVNKSEWQTTAHMSFPFPAKTGLFDEMHLRVNGADVLDDAGSDDDSINWNTAMPPGSTVVVEIGYRSRGLEHLRYIPKRMSQTGHYRVSMVVDGIPPGKLDYPIGSMPPAENLAEIKNTSYSLTWKLDNALTSYDIGVKLPAAEQPEYYFERLLGEAPVGLIILFILLAIPRIILGERVRPEVMAFLGAAYCLHYTFMGRMADLMSGFFPCFVISFVTLILLIGWFRLSDRECRFLGRQDTLWFAVMAVLYPLAVVDADRTAFWMQFFVLGMLTLFCGLFIWRHISRSSSTCESVGENS